MNSEKTVLQWFFECAEQNRGKENSQSTPNLIVEKVEALDPGIQVTGWHHGAEGLEIRTNPADQEAPVVFRITLA